MGRIVDRIDQVPRSIGGRHPVVIDRGWGIILEELNKLLVAVENHFLFAMKDIVSLRFSQPKNYATIYEYYNILTSSSSSIIIWCTSANLYYTLADTGQVGRYDNDLS